ncbi:hypothetical protein EAH68_03770 [Corynebacterium hylobatis]|uniref:Uncharacterized protein n=1 Tax=Corynebacterium hylobatis TaxID=1859290 RepID=A0A430I086_9CORY|nr:hypothetical protein [Corynebacterium hylobatis]RSZ64727.1 hypothetical protein EAH68_03770 [Corynebacterium hylobatis]
MDSLPGTLRSIATWCWRGGLLAFIVTTVMARDSWDTNIGASFALALAMFLVCAAQAATFVALWIWVAGRARGELTDPATPLRNLLWGATTVLLLAAALLMFTGFEFSSPGIIYLLGSAVVTGLAAASVSVEASQRSRHPSEQNQLRTSAPAPAPRRPPRWWRWSDRRRP